MKIEYFRNTTHHAFGYTYERELAAKEEVILKMPPITPNKRGINDIGFAYEGDVVLSGTLSAEPLSDDAVWQIIQPFDEITKPVSYIKNTNQGDTAAKINIRAILN